MDNHNSKRFSTLEKYKGIRKDNLTNKFIATKSIGGKRYYSSFDFVKDAVSWKNSFHPSTIKEDDKSVPHDKKEINGKLTTLKLHNVWDMFFTQHLKSKEISTQETYTYLYEIFSSEKNTPINDFNPNYLNEILIKIKNELISNSSRRKNFKAPLKFLKTMLNWYKENYDHTFVCPILKRHFVIGKIDDVKSKNKKMSAHEVINFFEHLPEFYRDFALVHFYIAGRVQEVAGIQWNNVNLKERSLLIKDVVVWSRYNRKFVELKSNTKNGETRYAHINDTLFEIFTKKQKDAEKDSNFVFHKNGEPLSYRQIQAAYNRALKAAGLSQYSSTHIMRHSMATLTRRVTGSLEATQAVTGHKDQKLVQHYASLPATTQIEAVRSVEKYIQELSN